MTTKTQKQTLKTKTNSQIAYYKSILENIYKNASKTWKVINKTTNKQKK